MLLSNRAVTVLGERNAIEGERWRRFERLVVLSLPGQLTCPAHRNAARNSPNKGERLRLLPLTCQRVCESGSWNPLGSPGFDYPARGFVISLW